MPLFGLLVGATLLALSLALRTSAFRFARRLGTAAALVGGVLWVVAPFSGFGASGGSALLAVVAILVATGGISALLAVALVKLGLLLWKKGKAEPAT